MTREGGDHYYKKVALYQFGTGSPQYYSLFDAKTEYKIGQPIGQRVKRNHGGGYYVYRTVEQAARVPTTASNFATKYSLTNWAILRMRCSGAYVRYEGGKLAFTHVEPIEEVSRCLLTITTANTSTVITWP